MNVKRRLLKNLLYTLLSNIISTVISVLVVAILPNALGTSGYGYYQLFLFYVSYVGIMHLGLNDGIYLQNSGKDYCELNKDQLHYEFWAEFLFLSFITIIGVTIVWNVDLVNQRKFVIVFSLFYMITSNLRGMLLYVLQITDRIKQYSLMNVSGRCFFIILVLFSLVSKCDFKIIIIADSLGRLISLIIGIIYCKDIVFASCCEKINYSLIFENISCGSKLLLANLSGQLILGVIKFGIERNWDIEIFGKVSLAITASNMLMMLANAIGLVVYPMICKLEREKLDRFYDILQKSLGTIMLTLLLIYFPFKIFVNHFMPNYMEAVYFMALAFPATIFEAKMAILLNNYMKKTRCEKWMLIINLGILGVGAILVYIFSVLIHNLMLSVSLLVILLCLRSGWVELFIKKNFNIGSIKELVLQDIMVLLFIVIALFFNSLQGLITYIFICILFLFYERNNLHVLYDFGKNS